MIGLEAEGLADLGDGGLLTAILHTFFTSLIDDLIAEIHFAVTPKILLNGLTILYLEHQADCPGDETVGKEIFIVRVEDLFTHLLSTLNLLSIDLKTEDAKLQLIQLVYLTTPCYGNGK